MELVCRARLASPGVIRTVEFVVGVENNQFVVFILLCNIRPPRLEAHGVGNDITIEAAIVVRLHHRILALGSDVLDLLRQVSQVERIEGAIELVGCEALHY